MKAYHAIALLIAALPLSAQSPIPSPVEIAVASCLAKPDSTCVQVSVNWPNRDIIRAKYGSLPNSIFPGEVTGCNRGPLALTFTQGEVIQALKQYGLEAYSRTDAIAVISAAQRGTFRNAWLRWSPIALAGLNVFTGGLANGVISAGRAVTIGAVGLTELANRELPLINGGIGADPHLTYEADGMLGIMAIGPAGSPSSCVVGTVMFAKGAAQPSGSSAPSFVLRFGVTR